MVSGEVKVLDLSAERCLSCVETSVGVEALAICGKRLVVGGSDPNSCTYLLVFEP